MRTRGATLLVCALLLASSAFALDVPPPPTRWFTDTANLVSPTDADLLNRKLSDFEQSSGAQFLVYTFPSIQGDAPEDFAIRCARQWGVGQKKYNNGLILFVFAEDHKARVEVGYGLEGTITDVFSSRVIREFIAPAFQQGKYGEGLNAAADAIMQKIRTGEEPVAPLQPRGSGQTSSGRGEIGPQAVIFILVIVFFVILPMLSRRRGGGCGGCMLPLFLSGGGRTFGGGGFGGWGFSGGGFGGGGFSGGGGGFGGGGATGGW
jgi:uncharacterized protein